MSCELWYMLILTIQCMLNQLFWLFEVIQRSHETEDCNLHIVENKHTICLAIEIFVLSERDFSCLSKCLLYFLLFPAPLSFCGTWKINKPDIYFCIFFKNYGYFNVFFVLFHIVNWRKCYKFPFKKCFNLYWSL